MILPTVRLFFLCSRLSEGENAISIRNPIRKVYIERFPQTVRAGAYAMLDGGIGEWRCRLEIYSEDGIVVHRTKPTLLAYQAKDRHRDIHLPLQLDDWKVQKPGLYHVSLLFNYREQATWPISIISSKE